MRAGTGPRCCWSPTTSTRRSCWPTGCSCSTTGRDPPTCASTLDRRPRPADPAFAACAAELLAALGVEDAAASAGGRQSTAGAGPAPTHAAPQRVPDEHRPPRGRLAAAGERPVRPHRRRALRATWPASPSAASSTRSSSPTARCCGASVGRRPAGTLEPTVLLTALAGGDRAHRADRHRVDHLQRAVQPGPPVRLARPRQRRPGRLEHRHHRRRRRGPQLRPRRAAGAPASATSGPPSSSTSSLKLWDSWEDDASLGDKEPGVWGDDDQVHPIDHAGSYFRVAGPLNVPRSPQGYPLLVQAGSSEDGKELRRPLRRGGLHRAADARRRAGVLRRPQARAPPRPAATRTAIKILPGIVPVIGATEARGAGAGGRARPADPARVRAARSSPRTLRVAPERPARWTASCPPTCPTRTRSRAPRAATR